MCDSAIYVVHHNAEPVLWSNIAPGSPESEAIKRSRLWEEFLCMEITSGLGVVIDNRPQVKINASNL